MKYTAINIGPIISTLGLARKPRELWSASYIFSHLMRYIIESLPKDVTIISPARLKESDYKLGIGLYPDRVFVEGEISNCDDVFSSAFAKLKKEFPELKKEYFNIMSVCCEVESESRAIKELNYKLNTLELFNPCKTEEQIESIKGIISNTIESKLYEVATGKKEFPIESLGVIAASEFKDKVVWPILKKNINNDNSESFHIVKDSLKSYHKYICVVQADGDNVGKTVSNEKLQDGKVAEISAKLLEFGKNASKKIEEFGGLPIYAGGDDLLFIVPVVGQKINDSRGNTIFDLIDEIDKSFEGVKEIVDKLQLVDNGKAIKASLSYGVSITYYKYPLYEALNNALSLLFSKAKHIDGKNAIAWNLQKHSGSSFKGAFSKSDADFKSAFRNVIENTCDEKTVSAVSHKIRHNDALLSIIADDSNMSNRVDYFFKKFMDEDGNAEYYDSVKALLKLQLTKMSAYENKEGEDNKSQFITDMYGMLRTAKFIKGEEAKDE